MRKFKELEFEDRLRFYHWTVRGPGTVILFFLAAYEIEYSLISYLFTMSILADLIFFGLFDNKKGDNNPKQKKYSYYNLIIDASCLYLATFLATSFLTPYILFLISNFSLSTPSITTTSFWINYIAILISVLLIYLFWYIITLIQNVLSPSNSVWKWNYSGLFSSTKGLSKL